MPKLNIEQSHQLKHDEVRRRLETLQTRLAEKYGIEGTWVSDTEAKIKRTGAHGSIKCEPGRVVVHLDLSFALTPVKGKVEHRVREELKRCLADSEESAGDSAQKPA